MGGARIPAKKRATGWNYVEEPSDCFSEQGSIVSMVKTAREAEVAAPRRQRTHARSIAINIPREVRQRWPWVFRWFLLDSFQHGKPTRSSVFALDRKAEWLHRDGEDTYRTRDEPVWTKLITLQFIFKQTVRATRTLERSVSYSVGHIPSIQVQFRYKYVPVPSIFARIRYARTRDTLSTPRGLRVARNISQGRG